MGKSVCASSCRPLISVMIALSGWHESFPVFFARTQVSISPTMMSDLRVSLSRPGLVRHHAVIASAAWVLNCKQYVMVVFSILQPSPPF